MTILIISIVAAWIIFSALLVTIICVNSARIGREQEHYRVISELKRQQLEKQHE